VSLILTIIFYRTRTVRVYVIWPITYEQYVYVIVEWNAHFPVSLSLIRFTETISEKNIFILPTDLVYCLQI